MAHPTTKMENAHRSKIIELAYKSIVAAAYKLRKQYRTAFDDIDLTTDDLGQFGVLKAIEYYDRLYAEDPGRILALPEEELKTSIVKLAMRCIACQIIDVYRKRDHRRSALVPDHLASDLDDSDARRIELWRRIEPIMAAITPRQRQVVISLWHGLDTDEVGLALNMTTNVVQKDIAAVRRAACA